MTDTASNSNNTNAVASSTSNAAPAKTTGPVVSKTSKFLSFMASLEDKIIPTSVQQPNKSESTTATTVESNSTAKSVGDFFSWKKSNKPTSTTNASPSNTNNDHNSTSPRIELKSYNHQNQLTPSKYHTYTIKAIHINNNYQLNNATANYKWLRINNNANNSIETICETNSNSYELTLDDVGCKIACIYNDSTNPTIQSNQSEIGPIARDPSLVSLSVETFVTGQASFIVREQSTDELMTLTIKRTNIRVVPVRGGDSKFSFRITPQIKFILQDSNNNNNNNNLKFAIEDLNEKRIFRGIADTNKTRDIIGLLIRRLTQPIVSDEEDESNSNNNTNSENTLARANSVQNANPIVVNSTETISNNANNSNADLDLLSGSINNNVTNSDTNGINSSINPSPKSATSGNEPSFTKDAEFATVNLNSSPVTDNTINSDIFDGLVRDTSNGSVTIAEPIVVAEIKSEPNNSTNNSTAQSDNPTVSPPIAAPVLKLQQSTTTSSPKLQPQPPDSGTTRKTPLTGEKVANFFSSLLHRDSGSNSAANSTNTNNNNTNSKPNSTVHSRHSSVEINTNNFLSPAPNSANSSTSPNPLHLTNSPASSSTISPKPIEPTNQSTNNVDPNSTDVTTLQAEIVRLQQQNKQLSQRITDINSEKLLLNNEIARLMEVQRVSDKEFAAKMEQLMNEKDRTMHLTQQQLEDNNALKTTLQTLSEQISNAANDNIKLMNENKQLKSDLTQQLNRNKELINTVESTNNELKQLKEYKDKYDNINNQFNTINTQYQTSLTTITTQKKEIDIYRRELTRIKELNTKLDTLEMDNHRLIRELDIEKNKNFQANTEKQNKLIDTLNNSINELKLQLQNEQNNNEKLTVQLNELKELNNNNENKLNELLSKQSNYTNIESELNNIKLQRDNLQNQLKQVNENNTTQVNYWKKKCESLQQVLKEKQTDNNPNNNNNSSNNNSVNNNGSNSRNSTPRNSKTATNTNNNNNNNNDNPDTIISKLRRENVELSSALDAYKKAFDQQLSRTKQERETNLYLQSYPSMIPPTEYNNLKELANNLTEQIANKDIALQHMKQTNVILSKRVQELENKFKHLLEQEENNNNSNNNNNNSKDNINHSNGNSNHSTEQNQTI